MNYRRATLLAEKNLVGTGTEVIEVVTRQPISRITLAWRVTKTQGQMNSYPHTDIVRIELVDGSDVLHSLDGGQNQAVCIYDRLCPSMNHGQHLNQMAEYSVYGIDFGRWRHDPMLVLDPARFMNLQLKVSYDSNNCDDGAASGNLEVWADLFDEKVSTPVGFLMTKEHHKRIPPAATGYWYVDLPTDFPIRKMFIQGYQKAKEPWNNVIEAKLDEENEKRIPLDWDLEDYHRIMKGVWHPVEEQIVGTALNLADSHFYVTPTDFYSCPGLSPMGNANLWVAGWGTGGDLVFQGAGVQQFAAMVHGWLPNHTFEFPFGDPKDLADWYDVTKLGSLRLRMRAGAGGAVGTVSAILQQLRYY